ncbi:MAG: hypothetical protein ACK58J_20415, partial [Planctomyces sp.]
LVAKLDLQSIQPAKETFLTATDNESRLDLLFTARLLDGTSLLKLQFLNFCRDGKKVIPKTMH